MDPRDTSPIQTGVRELREETGYQGETAEIIGRIFPNPAIMSNLCYTVLAQNCRLQHPTELDDGEDLATRLVPAAEIPELIAAGKIRHSLMVVGLYFLNYGDENRNEPAVIQSGWPIDPRGDGLPAPKPGRETLNPAVL